MNPQVILPPDQSAIVNPTIPSLNPDVVVERTDVDLSGKEADLSRNPTPVVLVNKNKVNSLRLILAAVAVVLLIK